MGGWLRRLRGALGMGLTWAAAWFGLWAAVGLGSVVLNGSGALTGMIDAIMLPVAGFVAGATFSVILGIAERRRRFDQVSIPRFALWGALGGFLMFGAGGAGDGLYGVAVNGSIMAFLCAGSAVGSLVLARRADDRELLHEGEDAATVGLTEEDRRRLLGPGPLA